jgi:hypothetical protein
MDTTGAWIVSDRNQLRSSVGGVTRPVHIFDNGRGTVYTLKGFGVSEVIFTMHQNGKMINQKDVQTIRNGYLLFEALEKSMARDLLGV